LRRLQGSITESLRVALTSFCKVDNLLRHRLTDRVGGPVGALERYKSHFECDAHDPDRLRVEPLAFEEKSDRHMHLPFRRERYRALSHRRLLNAWPVIFPT
jgi:hypothetical protein